MSQQRPATSYGQGRGGSMHNPSPPAGMYVNSTVARAASASRRTVLSRPNTAGSHMPSRPGTADATVFNKKLRKNRTFLKDNEAAGQLLPQPLPDGIPYVAQFTTFDDLIERKILHQTEAQQVHLTTSDVQLMYEAKCLDQNLKPSWEREVRFMELLSGSCKGGSFTLRENGLGHASAEAIARVLAENENYSIVDLGGNRFRDPGARCIAQLLQMNESIVHLSLKSNDIGHDGGEAIALALEQNNTLTSLDLGGISGINRNHLGSHGAAALGQMLALNPVLAYLNVSSNGLGADGIEKLAQGLSDGQNTTLISFNLSSNNLGTDGCEKLGPALESTRLTNLDLQRNATGDRGTAYLCRHIKAGTMIASTLIELLLDSNNIRELGAKAIARFLKGTSKLQTLSLSDNPLTTGAQHIAEALKENRSVTDLRMAHCMLTGDEAKALASTLMQGVSPGTMGQAFAAQSRDGGGKGGTISPALIASPASLTAHMVSSGGVGGGGSICPLVSLDLSRNGIADVGAAVLADALRTGGRNLQVLNLGSNGIGDIGGEALALMIRENPTLNDLSLRQNLMAASGTLVEEQLRKNNSIRKLDFSYNDFDYRSYAGITHSLTKNQSIWNRAQIPRLTKEIDELGSAHTELFHIQEEIDLEKRFVREKTDDNSRRREKVNADSDRWRKTLEDLRESLEVAKEDRWEKEKQVDGEVGKYQQRNIEMEQEERRLKSRCDAQIKAKDKAETQAYHIEKQLKAIHLAEEDALKPLLYDYKKANDAKISDLADAKYAAENLVKAEQRIAQLEKQLGMDTPLAVLNAPPAKPEAGGARGTASARPRGRR